MSNNSYDFYIKNKCFPIRYDVSVGSYIFGQSTVDFLLDRLVKLETENAKLKTESTELWEELAEDYGIFPIDSEDEDSEDEDSEDVDSEDESSEDEYSEGIDFFNINFY